MKRNSALPLYVRVGPTGSINVLNARPGPGPPAQPAKVAAQPKKRVLIDPVSTKIGRPPNACPKLIQNTQMAKQEIPMKKKSKLNSATESVDMNQTAVSLGEAIKSLSVMKDDLRSITDKLKDYENKLKHDYEVKIYQTKRKHEQELELIQNNYQHELLSSRKQSKEEIVSKEREVKVAQSKVEQLKMRMKQSFNAVSPPENQMIAFLDRTIAMKEEELECPVCYELPAPPIYKCPEDHLICNRCRPKLQQCPQCKLVYPHKYQVHRYAERDLMELKDLQRQREELD